LLAILTKLSLHLLLELLRLALQHLLLPFLFGSLGSIALLLGYILLAPGVRSSVADASDPRIAASASNRR
jgi:hypothetical protein